MQHREIVQLLARAREPKGYEADDKGDDSALVRAVQNGDMAGVIALATPDNVNTVDSKQRTPLMCAGHPAIAQVLIAAKADVNYCNSDMSVLSMHCSNRSPHMVRCLLNAKANPNIVAFNPKTPLQHAFDTPHESRGNLALIVELLLNAEAHIFVNIDSVIDTVLHCEFRRNRPVNADFMRAARLVLRSTGPGLLDYPDTNNNGSRFLEDAINENNYDITKALLELKADPHIRAHDGTWVFEDILRVADDKSVLPLIQMLIATGNSSVLNIQGDNRNTCLHNVIKARDFETAGLLIDAGVDVNIIGRNGCSPLHHVCEGLSSAPSKNRKKYLDIARRILEANGTATINRYDNDSCTALEYAVEAKDASLVDLLLSNGAAVNTLSLCLNPMLIIAATSSFHAGVFRTLVAHGADYNFRDRDGMTVLHCLVEDEDEPSSDDEDDDGEDRMNDDDIGGDDRVAVGADRAADGGIIDGGGDVGAERADAAAEVAVAARSPMEAVIMVVSEAIEAKNVRDDVAVASGSRRRVSERETPPRKRSKLN
jgi:ankyrin repeat protein